MLHEVIQSIHLKWCLPLVYVTGQTNLKYEVKNNKPNMTSKNALSGSKENQIRILKDKNFQFQWNIDNPKVEKLEISVGLLSFEVSNSIIFFVSGTF